MMNIKIKMKNLLTHKISQIHAPKPYRVLPYLFKAYTTSSAVTVCLLECSV